MAEKENKISTDVEKTQKVAKPAKVKKENDKPGFFSRLGKWFKGLKSEFKKITWSSRKSTLKNFCIVMAIVVASAVVIGLVDVGLGALLNLLHRVVN